MSNPGCEWRKQGLSVEGHRSGQQNCGLSAGWLDMAGTGRREGCHHTAWVPSHWVHTHSLKQMQEPPPDCGVGEGRGGRLERVEGGLTGSSLAALEGLGC